MTKYNELGHAIPVGVKVMLDREKHHRFQIYQRRAEKIGCWAIVICLGMIYFTVVTIESENTNLLFGIISGLVWVAGMAAGGYLGGVMLDEDAEKKD